MSEISTCAYLLAFKWFVTKFLLFYQCILYFQENRKEERKMLIKRFLWMGLSRPQ